MLIIGTFAAYALARLDFRGKNLALSAIIATSMFPGIALVVPLLKIFTDIGWINTYQALILPSMSFALPLAVWNLTAFFRQMPQELEQAAMVDGCTQWQAFRKVIIPLAAPGVFTTAIIAFVAAWNEFIIALTMTNKSDFFTAVVAISQFQGKTGRDIPFGSQMAAGVILTDPAGDHGAGLPAPHRERPDRRRREVAGCRNDDWWRDAVIYQVYIRSFADGDGDGLGDIAGIRSRLRYLADLGVDAVWINPWYPSPMADAGYDVSDYRDVEPRFGTLADAEALIARGARARAAGAARHRAQPHLRPAPLVRRGAGAPARGRRRATATCSGPAAGADGDEPPNDWQSVFGGPAWKRVTEADGSPGEWYLHLFAPEQPDLNWEHPEVRADFEETLRFWFDRGVDGFRIDVAHSLVKEDGLPDADGPGVAAAAGRGRRRAASARRGSRTRSGTATRCTRSTAPGGGSPTPTTRRGCSSPRRGSTSPSGWPATCAPTSCTPPSTSPTCSAPWDAGYLRHVIDETLDEHGAVGAPATWVLSNHDVVRHVSRYAREQDAPGQQRRCSCSACRPTSSSGAAGPARPCC